jgi:hypothetical protein
MTKSRFLRPGCRIYILPGAPRWRQLGNGGFVDIDDIFEALCQIDDLQSYHRNGAVEPTEP